MRRRRARQRNILPRPSAQAPVDRGEQHRSRLLQTEVKRGEIRAAAKLTHRAIDASSATGGRCADVPPTVALPAPMPQLAGACAMRASSLAPPAACARRAGFPAAAARRRGGASRRRGVSCQARGAACVPHAHAAHLHTHARAHARRRRRDALLRR
jgi:hypothetical protein